MDQEIEFTDQLRIFIKHACDCLHIFTRSVYRTAHSLVFILLRCLVFSHKEIVWLTKSRVTGDHWC